MTQASGGSGDKAERPVQRLPLNVVQQLKRDPSSGRYGRSDLMDVKEKQDLLYSVQEENMSLKKTNVKLAEQVKQLGVRFGQIQKEMQREGYVVDKPASQKEVERLHKALNDGFTGTSASSSSQPWVPATGRSKSPGPGGGGPKSPGVTKQTRRAVTGTGMLRNRTALSPGGRGPSPERSGVARMLVEETEALRKQIGDLKDKNERLTNQMEGVMSARGNKGVSAVEVAFYREQLDDKEQRIKQLQKSLDEDRDSFHKERKEMTATVNRLEKEKLAVESDLRHALALGDETENASLHRKVKESDDMNKKLMEKINSLTSNAFISTADTRVASAKRLERLEEELVEKQKALEGAIADKQKVTFEITEMKNKVTAAEEKYKTTWEENERIRIRLEEREKQAKAVEEQLQVLRDSLPPEERAAVEKSLSLALTSSVVPAAFASSQVERGATSVPSKSDVGSIEGLTKVVSQLRREKADLAQEMTALQNILRRESEINAELKTLHQYDLADMQTKSEAMLADREKWERLAKSRETKVKDLQKQIRQLEQVQVERDDDVISEAGFSDISADMQQSSENNALDLVVNSAKIEFKVLSQHFFPNMPIFLAENSLMTNVLIDFYEFDTVSSRTASGLEPRYDSIITCSPFVMNEQAIKFFNTGAIRFSLQAFAIPQQQQQGQNPALAATQGPPVVVGEAILPLVHLLNCTPLDPNPMVSGTLKFVSKKDPNTTIAHLSYKMKLRFSVLDLLHNFQHQRNKDELSLQMAKPEFDPALVDQIQQLFVQFYQCSGFTKLPTNILDSGRVYLQYDISGYERPIATKAVRFTNIAQGTCRFDEDRRVPVRVNDQFLMWAESGRGLTIGLYADSTKQKLAEVRVPIQSLLRDSMGVVRGNFTMKTNLADPRSVALGSVDLAIRWVDVDRSRVKALAAGGQKAKVPVTQELFTQVLERMSRRLQQQRVSARAWFEKADLDRDGMLSTQEFTQEALKMPLGIDADELKQVFTMLDVSKRRFVSLQEFESALREAEAKNTPLEQWRKDCLLRLATACKWAGKEWKQVFFTVTKGNVLARKDFETQLGNFSLGVRPDQVKKLWQVFDKESSGYVHFNDFVDAFQTYVGTGNLTTTAFVAPKALESGGTVVDAGEMDDAYFYICLNRIINKLKDKGFPQAGVAFTTFDADKDGKLGKGDVNRAFKELQLGFSDLEIDMLFARLASRGGAGALTDSLISLEDLKNAITEAEISTNKQPILWTIDIFSKLKGAIARSGKDTVDVYNGLVENNRRGLVDEGPFLNLIRRMNPGLSDDQLATLWRALDKSADGCLTMETFQRQFGKSGFDDFLNSDLVSEEYYVILLGKLFTKLLQKGFRTTREAFDSFDTDKDQKITQQEFDEGCRRLGVGGSSDERLMVFKKIDVNGDGVVNSEEFEKAIVKGSQYEGIERWAKEIIQRIVNAIQSSGKSLQQVFDALVGSSPTMRLEHFQKLLTAFDDSLSPSQLKRLWQLADKNNDGSVDFTEFQAMFGPQSVFLVGVAGGQPGTGVLTPQPIATSTAQRALNATSSRTSPQVTNQNMAFCLVNRLSRNLQYKNATVHNTFGVYALATTGPQNEPAIPQADWQHALGRGDLGLSAEEGLWLLKELTQGAAPNDVGKLSLPLLENLLKGAPKTQEVETWTRQWIKQFDMEAMRRGHPKGLVSSFESFGSAPLQMETLRSEIGRFATRECTIFTDDEWDKISVVVDKDAEGRAQWTSFFRWINSGEPLALDASAAGGPRPEDMKYSATTIGGVNVGYLMTIIREKVQRRGVQTKDIFFRFNQGRDQTLTKAEFVQYLQSMPLGLTTVEREQLFTFVDSDGDGRVSYTEFDNALSYHFGANIGQVQADEKWALDLFTRIKASLKSADTTGAPLETLVANLFEKIATVDPTDRHKSVTKVSLFQTLRMFEQSASEAQLEKLFAMTDKDGTGNIDYDEFLAAVLGIKPSLMQSKNPVQQAYQNVLETIGSAVPDPTAHTAQEEPPEALKKVMAAMAAALPAMQKNMLQVCQVFDADADGRLREKEVFQLFNAFPEPVQVLIESDRQTKNDVFNMLVDCYPGRDIQPNENVKIGSMEPTISANLFSYAVDRSGASSEGGTASEITTPELCKKIVDACMEKRKARGLSVGAPGVYEELAAYMTQPGGQSLTKQQFVSVVVTLVPTLRADIVEKRFPTLPLLTTGDLDLPAFVQKFAPADAATAGGPPPMGSLVPAAPMMPPPQAAPKAPVNTGLPFTVTDVQIDPTTFLVDVVAMFVRELYPKQSAEITFRQLDPQGLGEVNQKMLEDGLRQLGCNLAPLQAANFFEQLKIVSAASLAANPLKTTVSKADFTEAFGRANKNNELYYFAVIRRIVEAEGAGVAMAGTTAATVSSPHPLLETVWARGFGTDKQEVTKYEVENWVAKYDLTLSDAQKDALWAVLCNDAKAEKLSKTRFMQVLENVGRPVVMFGDVRLLTKQQLKTVMTVLETWYTSSTQGAPVNAQSMLPKNEVIRVLRYALPGLTSRGLEHLLRLMPTKGGPAGDCIFLKFREKLDPAIEMQRADAKLPKPYDKQALQPAATYLKQMMEKKRFRNMQDCLAQAFPNNDLKQRESRVPWRDLGPNLQRVLGLSNQDIANLLQNEATSILQLTLMDSQTQTLDLVELGQRMDHLCGTAQTTGSDPKKAVRASQDPSPMVDLLSLPQQNALVYGLEDLLVKKEKEGPMLEQVFQTMETSKLVAKTLSANEKMAVQNYLSADTIYVENKNFAALFAFSVQVEKMSLKQTGPKEFTWRGFFFVVKFAGYSVTLPRFELPKATGFFKKSEIQPVTWRQFGEFFLDGPNKLAALDIRKAMDPNAPEPLTFELYGEAPAENTTASISPRGGAPAQLLGSFAFRLGQEPWMPGRDLRFTETKIVNVEPQTKKPMFEFNFTVSTRNAGRLLEALSKPSNGWAKQEFSQNIFGRIFEKRQKESRPIFFAQGVAEEVKVFSARKDDALQQAEFGKFLERFAEPTLTRNPVLMECLWKAAYRVSPDMLEVERGLKTDIPLAIPVDAFVKTYMEERNKLQRSATAEDDVLSVENVDPVLYDMLMAEIRFRILMRRQSLSALFRQMDESGDGNIDVDELFMAFKKTLNAEFSRDQVRMLHNFMAKGETGGDISEAHFVELFGRMSPTLDSYLFLMLRQIAYHIQQNQSANYNIDMLWRSIPRTSGDLTKLYKPEFLSFVQENYDCTLTPQQMDRLWLLVDRERKQFLDQAMFARILSAPVPVQKFEDLAQVIQTMSSKKIGSLLKMFEHLDLRKTRWITRNEFCLALKLSMPVELGGEVELNQILRLAPNKGGPMDPYQTYNYHEFLQKLEEKVDVNRGPLDDVRKIAILKSVQDVQQILSRKNIVSLQSLMQDIAQQVQRETGAAAVNYRVDCEALVNHLRARLELNPEEVLEYLSGESASLLYLGTISDVLGRRVVDVMEIAARFEHLRTEEEALVRRASKSQSGAASPGLADQVGSLAMKRKPARAIDYNDGRSVLCPLRLPIEKQAELCEVFEVKYKDGVIPFDKLSGSLVEMQAGISRGDLDSLQKWSQQTNNAVYYPAVTCFSVMLEKMCVKSSAAKDYFTQFRLDLSFGQQMVALNSFTPPKQQKGFMGGVSKVFMPTDWFQAAEFYLDGPERVSLKKLVAATQADAKAEDMLTLFLYGLDATTNQWVPLTKSEIAYGGPEWPQGRDLNVVTKSLTVDVTGGGRPTSANAKKESITLEFSFSSQNAARLTAIVDEHYNIVLNRLRLKIAESGKSLADVVKLYDADNSGTIDRQECDQVLSAFPCEIDAEERAAVFTRLAGRKGEIPVQDFIDVISHSKDLVLSGPEWAVMEGGRMLRKFVPEAEKRKATLPKMEDALTDALLDFARAQPKTKGLLSEDEFGAALASVGYTDLLNMTRVLAHISRDRQGNVNVAAFVQKCWSASAGTVTPRVSQFTQAAADPMIPEIDLFVEPVAFHLFVVLRERRQPLDALFRAFPSSYQLSESELVSGLNALQVGLSPGQIRKISQFNLAPNLQQFRQTFFESRSASNGFEVYYRNVIQYAADNLTREAGSTDNAFAQFAKDGRVELFQFKTILMKYDLLLSEKQLDEAWNVVMSKLNSPRLQAAGRPSQNALDLNTFRQLFQPSSVVPPSFDTWVPGFMKANFVMKLNLLKPRLRALDTEKVGYLENKRIVLSILQITAYQDLTGAGIQHVLSMTEALQVLRFMPFKDVYGRYDYEKFAQLVAEEDSFSNPVLDPDQKDGLKAKCAQFQKLLEQKQIKDFATLLAQVSPPGAAYVARQTLVQSLTAALGLLQSDAEQYFLDPATGLLLLGFVNLEEEVLIQDLAQKFDAVLGVTSVTVDAEESGLGRFRDNVSEFDSKNPVLLQNLMQQLHIAQGVATEYPGGLAPFHKLQRLVETATSKPLALNEQQEFMKWLGCDSIQAVVRYAPVLAFNVQVRNFHIKYNAESRLQQQFRQLRFVLSFCNCRVVGNGFAIAAAKGFQNVKVTPIDPNFWQRADFYLDGPKRLSVDDLKKALALDGPDSHLLTVEVQGEVIGPQAGQWISLARMAYKYRSIEWPAGRDLDRKKEAMQVPMGPDNQRGKLSFHFDVLTDKVARLEHLVQTGGNQTPRTPRASGLTIERPSMSAPPPQPPAPVADTAPQQPFTAQPSLVVGPQQSVTAMQQQYSAMAAPPPAIGNQPPASSEPPSLMGSTLQQSIPVAGNGMQQQQPFPPAYGQQPPVPPYGQQAPMMPPQPPNPYGQQPPPVYQQQPPAPAAPLPPYGQPQQQMYPPQPMQPPGPYQPPAMGYTPPPANPYGAAQPPPNPYGQPPPANPYGQPPPNPYGQPQQPMMPQAAPVQPPAPQYNAQPTYGAQPPPAPAQAQPPAAAPAPAADPATAQASSLAQQKGITETVQAAEEGEYGDFSE
ncbi:unnamed protein product [Amoebophrya sp. A120]|nr:unnamed protein product [Amoebophrya sp. A120]|eukprot:GSA120T00004954001.1